MISHYNKAVNRILNFFSIFKQKTNVFCQEWELRPKPLIISETNKRGTNMKITLTELEQNPQLLTTAMEDLDNWYVVNNHIRNVRNVPLNLIEKHCENAKTLGTENHCDYYLGYLRHALKAKPTPIQKTMTPFQLLQAGSPLWVRPFSPKEIGAINYFVRRLKYDGRDFNYVKPLFDLSLTPHEFNATNIELMIDF